MFSQLFVTDPDYKLKSAAQTPATLHNSHSNDLEVGRTVPDDRTTYLNTVCLKV